MKHFGLILLTILCPLFLFAVADGADLLIEIKNYKGPEVYLVNYIGDKAYVKDTLQAADPGQFHYQSEEKLKSGIYYIVLPPNNEFVEILITEEEQHYTLHMDHTRLTADRKFDNAPQNSLFQEYRLFMEDQTAIHEQIMVRKKKEADDGTDSQESDADLTALQSKVKKYQQEVISRAPESLTATIIRSQQAPDLPEFSGSEEEQREQEFWYAKAHYFDAFKTDGRLFTSNLFFQKVDQYFKRYTAMHPDSLIRSIDEVLQLVEPDAEAFQFYYLKFINEYLQSKYVGMDAVVVHLVQEYMEKGKTDAFINQKKRKEWTAKADRWATLLIGKTAPDFRSFHLDAEETITLHQINDPDRQYQLSDLVELHNLDSPFTLLLFWSPTCGHCKQAVPKLVEFSKKYKDKGLQVLAVCDKDPDEYPACAQAIKDWGMIEWINTVDPSALYRYLFYVDETPKMFLLDNKKEILLKGNLKIESLEEALDMFIEKN
ncbi:MAG: thioredoxin-like domain-containing protein [Saprospiraceae bacterium]|nr:redoxin domain-containing protein [Lewinella sp.]